MRMLFSGARLYTCLRHALLKLPKGRVYDQWSKGHRDRCRECLCRSSPRNHVKIRA